MARLLHSDVLKIFLYVAGALALGAAMAPWIYNAGMGLAEVTEHHETNGFFKWLGDAARRSQDNFPRFFDRSLMLAAVLLLFPLIAWLRLGRGQERFRDTPWSLRLPDHLVSRRGQALEKNPDGWMQLAMGMLLAGGLLMISGWVMTQAGFFVWRDAEVSTRGAPNPAVEEIDWAGEALGAVPTALVVSVIEEVLFRGVLLGIFLRAMRPGAAIGLLSFLFAFVHFLEPPAGSVVPDPEALDAGFVLLGQIASRFADPLAFAGRFLTLFAVAAVLGVARYRTASLWLPIGLHAGWILGYQLFKGATWPVDGLPPIAAWLVGDTLMEGLLPLAVVALTGVIMAFATRSAGDEEAADG